MNDPLGEPDGDDSAGMLDYLAPRQRYGRCWCGRPINHPGADGCAEHDTPPKETR